MVRDIKRDREMCEKATKGPWIVNPAEGDCNRFGSPCPRGLTHCDDKCPACEDWIVYKGTDVSGPTMEEYGDYCYFAEADAQFIAESRTMTPYYLNLCEHQQRMLEVAIDALAKPWAPCPRDVKCPYPNVLEANCRQCWSDYLNQKAKEGERQC